MAGTADPAVTGLSIPGATEWSNETILFDAAWGAGDDRRTRRLVARIAPSGHQVFPDETFLRQHTVMRALSERSDVPMATIHWLETDPSWFGRPFSIMDHVAADVPTDNPPYAGQGWLHDATPEQQARAWDAGVDAMAAVHRVVPEGTTDFQQFVLAAQDSGATGGGLALGEAEAIQVIRAAQQLSTDIVFSTSLGTFGQADAEALGEFADQVVFNSELPPATASTDRWPTLADVSGEAITAAFETAQGIDFFGLIPPWTPPAGTGEGVFGAVSNPYYFQVSFDPGSGEFVVDDELLNVVEEVDGNRDYPQPG
ncbi:MAG TPA: phosphotransferase [Acidimicrobiales bacterium]|nr:phosphotransferase [Acidimicrobiales bacterium]